MILISLNVKGSEPDSLKGPWIAPAVKIDISTEYPTFMADSLMQLTRFHQAYISGTVTRPCPSNPSCSAYMAEALSRHGFPLGYILGLERLLHETGELARGTVIQTPGGPRIHDPLINNTYWWDTHEN